MELDKFASGEILNGNEPDVCINTTIFIDEQGVLTMKNLQSVELVLAIKLPFPLLQ